MRMDRQRSQLLLIDLQARLVPAIVDGAEVVAAAARLAAFARRLSVPITASEQYRKGLGATVGELRDALGNDTPVLEKIAFSCLGDPGLAARIAELRGEGHDQVVVAGVEAHVCVGQSVLDLRANGLEVFVVAEAVGSRKPASKALALERMARAGATVVDAEMVAFEWLERAGTPEFKDLQALIK
jgi:nicotinamidase-related amidase